MPRGEAIDVDLIHTLLWNRSDRLGRLTVIQKELSLEVGCTHFTMNRVFRGMEAEGRIKKLQGHQGNTWTYLVRNPDLFAT
jgi:hypothetical protein